MQLYGCVVLCYANSVIRWHFSPVDLFQLPGDLTELKTDRPSFGIFTHLVRKQARIVFGPFSVQKDNTNLAQRSAPHAGFTSMQCIFPSCCRGGPRTPAVSSAPHPRTRGRCGSPAGLHPLIPVTSMRLPLPVLTVMAVSRGNLPETVGPRRWVHCVLF